MNAFKYYLIVFLSLFLRYVPFPTKTRLIKIGNPTKQSPVFLTGNYQLTVAKVRKTLKDLDCYLLVANSHGINVWCAATGGHFTNYDVMSALKTSGIEDLVEHRVVILPQLAATGISAPDIKKKSGWKVLWGPVDAKDIPQFLERNYKKTVAMKTVTFPLLKRIEIAVTLAIPFSLIIGIIIALLWPTDLFHLLLHPWIVSLLLLTSFPLYDPAIRWAKDKKLFGKITFSFEWFVLLPITTIIMLGFSWIYLNYFNLFTLSRLIRWMIIDFLIVAISTMDLMGVTPTYKSSMSEERFFRIKVDENACKGARFCEDVCPKNCFVFNEEKRIVYIPHEEQCVQCGACIVQCPFDALYFENPRGEKIAPEIIRTYKINMLGKRTIKAQKA